MHQDASKGAAAHAGGRGWRWGTQRARGMHVGWRQYVERGLGMSEGPGSVQRMGHILGGHGTSLHVAVCGAVRLDAGVVKMTRGWGPDACT